MHTKSLSHSKLVTAVVLGLSLTCVIFAEEEPANDEVVHLDPYYAVVTSRTPLLLSELSASTSFVGAEEIEVRQYRSVSDALESLPGASVVRSGQNGAVTSLFTRGTESNHTALLMNGRRLPSGFSGQYDLGLLGLDNIASVEFVRGASSSLYGADAIGGVVDLRSKVAEEGFSGSLQSEFGDFNSQNYQGQLLYGTEDFSLSFDAGYEETDNDRANSEYDRFSINAFTVFELAKNLSLDVQALFYDTELGVPGDERYAPAFYPNEEINETSAYLFSPRLTFELIEDLSLELLYSYTSNELDATNAPFVHDRRFTQNGNEAEALARYEPEDLPFNVILGSRYYDTQFEIEPISGSAAVPFKESYRSWSSFGQGIWYVTDNFRIIGSGRFDNYSDIEDAATGNIEASFKVDATNTIFFAKYGTGYAVPVGNDLSRLGGSDFEAEESRSWEVGFNQSLREGTAVLSLVYFQSEIENLVDDDGGWPIASYQVVDTEQEGIEATLDINPTSWISFDIGYTYLDAIITDGNYFGGYSGTPGDRLIRRPRHKFSANVEVDLWDRANVGAGLLATLDREDPVNVEHEDFTLVRIYGDWELFDECTVFARVENLLDEKYQYTPGYTGAGRTVYGGIRYSF